MPLAASLFGRKKLGASPWKVTAEADLELLQAFGAAQKSDIQHGVERQIVRLFRSVAQAIAEGSQRIENVKPVLEFIARKYAVGWLLLADLYREVQGDGSTPEVKACLQHYLERPVGPINAATAWKELADVCRRSGDVLGEIHALAEMSNLPDAPLEAVSNAASRVNALAGMTMAASVPKDEKVVLTRSIAAALERHRNAFDADDCSRLAWLYICLDEEAKALEIAREGLEVEPGNVHCRRIVERLAPNQLWY